jgi:hypothetical protein
VIGFEVDHMRTLGDQTPSRPRIEWTGASMLVQFHIVPRRLQAYGAVGGGVYTQTLGGDRSAGGGAANAGGGVKIALAGPLKLRLDYRVLFLSDDPDWSLEGLPYRHPQRVTAGLALAF